MQAKIQKSMTLTFLIVLLFSYVLISILIYNQNLSFLKSNVQQEAELIAFAINETEFGEDFFEKPTEAARVIKGLDAVSLDTRITYILRGGEIIYDSLGVNPGWQGAPLFSAAYGTRQDRAEVMDAWETGSGEAIRSSETTNQRMYYYAILLENGSVLRVARGMDNLALIALRILPYIVGLFVIMMLVVWFLARWQTARFVRPIIDLNLENPLENQSYAELQPLLEAIEEKNRAQDLITEMRKEFSANVSHELKTPLTSISGYAEIMMNDMVKHKDMPKFSARIYKEAKRLLSLVDDIIKLSRLDEGKIEAEKESLDLYDLSREIISRLALQAETKKVRIILTGEPVEYYGIRQLLDEMIYNLCENAIKYNQQRGRVYVWVGKTLEGIKISVSDTGIGISETEYERIFERFYRVDKSHSKESGGTGLGLSIVKHVAHLHNAKISVDSTLGHGTKIEIRF
ncbi:MAG: ATP-binding protein [Lachnospiraceae bacterium]|nr:ATP-binding protein [Lachnospiraceae bacterium]